MSPTTNLSNLAPEPPITSIGIINLAWSLILNISTEKRDIDLGTEILNIWKEIYRPTEKTSDVHAIRYLDNVSSLLFSFIESIAFERCFYYQYARTCEKKRTHSIDYWNDLADMTSFSKDGIVLRIVSFLGIGGGISLMNNPTSTDSNTQFIGTFLLFGFIGLVIVVIIIKVLRT